MKYVVGILTAIATAVAVVGSQACLIFWIDEPEIPAELMK